MTISEYYKEEDIFIDNKIYNLVYRVTEDGIYVLNFAIKPEYQGQHKHYTQRIFTNLCKKYNTYIYLECYGDLLSFYQRIGGFTMEPFSLGLMEIYFDPLNKF